MFPSARLEFSNGFGRIAEAVARQFPRDIDGFARFVRAQAELDPYHAGEPRESGREFLARFVADPLLVEMLLCPILFYGSAREDDIDGYQLVILFRSIFQEGFARPEGGIRRLLDLLVKRYRALGGELRMRAGVQEIQVEPAGSRRWRSPAAERRPRRSDGSRSSRRSRSSIVRSPRSATTRR